MGGCQPPWGSLWCVDSFQDRAWSRRGNAACEAGASSQHRAFPSPPCPRHCPRKVFRMWSQENFISFSFFTERTLVNYQSPPLGNAAMFQWQPLPTKLRVIKGSTYCCLHSFTIAPYIHSVFFCKNNKPKKIIIYDSKIKLIPYYFKKILIYWISKTPLTFHGFPILNLKKLCLLFVHRQNKNETKQSLKRRSQPQYKWMKPC